MRLCRAGWYARPSKYPFLPQEHETEYNLATMVEQGTSVPKADPSQFELLKVLGQGSFGKVSRAGGGRVREGRRCGGEVWEVRVVCETISYACRLSGVSGAEDRRGRCW